MPMRPFKTTTVGAAAALSPHPDRSQAMKSLDKAANIAVILAALLFIFVVVRTEIRKRTYPDPAVAELHRTVVDLPGVHFPKQNKSLIIAVSTTCHFCQDS